MKHATATATVAASRAGAPAFDHPGAEALLNFKLRPYQPRAAACEPVELIERNPAPPQSIKDAIIHWLDEQL